MTKSVFTAAYDAFCRQLVAERKKAGMTQAALAEVLGKPQSFVSKYERGERRLDVVEFVQIAAAIGLDPHDLIDGLMKYKAR